MRIAGPVIVNQMTVTLMNVIDMIMVGQLGVLELAAVGLAGMVLMALTSFFWGMFGSVNTLVAQSVGAGDRRAAGLVFWQGLHLALLSSALIALAWVVVPVIFRWTGATPEAQALAVNYTRLRLLGGLGFTAIAASSNFYYGVGRTQVPMVGAGLQLALNCGLNYALIFGNLGAPALGTAGAAIGTVVAQWIVGALLYASLLATPSLRQAHALGAWRWHGSLFRTLVGLALPMGAQLCLEVTSLTVFTSIIGRLGDAQLAASTAAFHSWSVAFMVGVGLSVSATTLVGQCVGARRPQDARTVVQRSLRLGYGAMTAAALVYLALPEQIMGAFVEELGVLRPYARPLLAMVAVVAVFDMQFTVLVGALRGAGDVTVPMLVNLCCPWLVFVPSTMWVAPRLDVTGAWGCLVFHYVLMATLLTLRSRGRAWLKAPRIQDQLEETREVATTTVGRASRTETD